MLYTSHIYTFMNDVDEDYDDEYCFASTDKVIFIMFPANSQDSIMNYS